MRMSACRNAGVPAKAGSRHFEDALAATRTNVSGRGFSDIASRSKRTSGADPKDAPAGASRVFVNAVKSDITACAARVLRANRRHLRRPRPDVARVFAGVIVAAVRTCRCAPVALSRTRSHPPALAASCVHHGCPRRRCPAARRADPRPPRRPATTTIYDRRRQNYDRHAAYAVVAFVTTGESPSAGASLRRWAGAPRTAQHTVRVCRQSCTTETRRALFGANTVDGRAAGIVAVGDQPAARASVRRSHQSPSRDASPRVPPDACRGEAAGDVRVVECE